MVTAGAQASATRCPRRGHTFRSGITPGSPAPWALVASQSRPGADVRLPRHRPSRRELPLAWLVTAPHILTMNQHPRLHPSLQPPPVVPNPRPGGERPVPPAAPPETGHPGSRDARNATAMAPVLERHPGHCRRNGHRPAPNPPPRPGHRRHAPAPRHAGRGPPRPVLGHGSSRRSQAAGTRSEPHAPEPGDRGARPMPSDSLSQKRNETPMRQSGRDSASPHTTPPHSQATRQILSCSETRRT